MELAAVLAEVNAAWSVEQRKDQGSDHAVHLALCSYPPSTHLCLVSIANGMIDSALQQVNLGEHGLVIQLLELLE